MIVRKLTLIEYAISTKQTVMSAFELAKESDALTTEKGNIYVDKEKIQFHIRMGGINRKGSDLNGWK